MNDIRPLKDIRKYNSIKEWSNDVDERVREIRSHFAKRKKKLLEYNNPSLIKFEELLIDRGLYYTREKCFFTEMGDLFYADFYIPSLQLCIEIDGGYHETQKRQYLDKIKQTIILEKGKATLRFTNEQVLGMTEINVASLIKDADYFWQNNKSSIGNYDYIYGEWKSKVNMDKSYYINRLKAQFKEELKTIDLNAEIEEFNPSGEVTWIFKNIFDAHFATGTKFKLILTKFTIIKKGWKTKFRFVEGEKKVKSFKNRLYIDSKLNNMDKIESLEDYLKRLKDYSTEQLEEVKRIRGGCEYMSWEQYNFLTEHGAINKKINLKKPRTLWVNETGEIFYLNHYTKSYQLVGNLKNSEE